MAPSPGVRPIGWALAFTSPTFTERDKGEPHAATLGAEAKAAGVKRLVYNTTSWHPDKLTGVPSMDRCYLRTKALQDSGVPLTVVRPSLFMDNLLTNWVKPELLATNEFSYPHKEDLQVSWICLDDVAKVMIATLRDESFAGEIIDVGLRRLGDALRSRTGLALDALVEGVHDEMLADTVPDDDACVLAYRPAGDRFSPGR